MARGVVLLLIVAFAGVAGAAPSKDDRDKANAHFKQGKAFYDQSQWQGAIDEYEAAWALVPQPLLQFNIGLAYEKQGNLEEALARYKMYLELDPKGAVADEAREYVATLTAKVEKLHADAAAAAAAEEARKKEAADAAAKAEAARLAEIQRQEDARKAAEEAERQRRLAITAAERGRLNKRARIYTLAAIGAGAFSVAALGVSTYYGLVARNDDAMISAHTGGAWTPELVATSQEGAMAGRNAMIFSIAGGAAAIAGVALYYLGHELHVKAEGLGVGGTF